jgi:predicted nucleic acid-binding protein
MRILLDTNILLRLSEKTHAHFPAAMEAVRSLAADGHTFCIGSQTISEFLAVATRSIPDRGLGMDQATADSELAKVVSAIEILYDSPAVLSELRRLVITHRVIGKSIHDTKLVAAMNANGVKNILTFNGPDFDRFAGINVRNPSTIAAWLGALRP